MRADRRGSGAAQMRACAYGSIVVLVSIVLAWSSWYVRVGTSDARSAQHVLSRTGGEHGSGSRSANSSSAALRAFATVTAHANTAADAPSVDRRDPAACGKETRARVLRASDGTWQRPRLRLGVDQPNLEFFRSRGRSTLPSKDALDALVWDCRCANCESHPDWHVMARWNANGSDWNADVFAELQAAADAHGAAVWSVWSEHGSTTDHRSSVSRVAEVAFRTDAVRQWFHFRSLDAARQSTLSDRWHRGVLPSSWEVSSPERLRLRCVHGHGCAVQLWLNIDERFEGLDVGSLGGSVGGSYFAAVLQGRAIQVACRHRDHFNGSYALLCEVPAWAWVYEPVVSLTLNLTVLWTDYAALYSTLGAQLRLMLPPVQLSIARSCVEQSVEAAYLRQHYPMWPHAVSLPVCASSAAEDWNWFGWASFLALANVTREALLLPASERWHAAFLGCVPRLYSSQRGAECLRNRKAIIVGDRCVRAPALSLWAHSASSAVTGAISSTRSRS